MQHTSQTTLEASERDLLAGTVKFYQRHLFVCTSRTDWPAQIEAMGGFVQALSQAIKERSSDMPLSIKMTACDAPSARPGSDLLLFPDQIRYQGVTEDDLPALIEEHLIGNQITAHIPHERLNGHYVFICMHGNRDDRCGRCGPPLRQRFQAELQMRGLTDQVTVHSTSHVGGHRFAGNVLMYPSGDWYGYVTPDDLPRLIDQYLLGKEIVTDLWRGRMGLSPQEKLQMTIQTNQGAKGTTEIIQGAGHGRASK